MASNQEELGLQIILSAESKGIVSAIRQTQSQVTQLQSSFRAFDKLTKFDATDVKTYNKELENLGTQITFQQKQLQNYGIRIQDINNRLAENNAKLDSNSESYEKNGLKREKIASLIEGDLKLLFKTNEKYAQETANLQRMELAYKDVQNTISALTGETKNNTTVFEENISKIQTNLQGIDSELGNVKKEISTAFSDDDKVNSYSQELGLLGNKISELKSLTGNYKVQQKSLDVQLEKSDATIEILEKRYAAAKKELDSFGERTKKNYKEYDEAAKKVNDLKEKLLQEKTARTQLQSQLDKNTTSQKETAVQLKLTVSEYRNVSQSLNQLKSDTSQYQKNLDNLSKQIDETDTHFKEIESTTKSAFNDTDKISGYSKQMEMLENKCGLLYKQFEQYLNIEKQVRSDIVETVDKIRVLTEKYGENSVQVLAAKDELSRLEDELHKNSEAQKTCQNTVEGLSNEYNNLDKELQDVKNNSNGTSTSLEEFSNKADALNVALGNLAAQGVRKAWDYFKRLGEAVISAGSDIEEANNQLAAVLEVGNDSYVISDLSDYFQELGTSTLYSSEELTKNATVLANAGYEADQIKDSIKAISDLAIGTGEDFSNMSNIVVDGLAAFGMKADEATHFSDVLAKSAISSNTNVSQMGEAFKYAGAIAGQFGYTVEDTGVALGAMASQGIKASTAGTSLRSIITRLANNTSGCRDMVEELGVSFYNADGSAKPLLEVLNGLRKKTSDMTDEQKASITQTVAGQRAMTALSAILNTSEHDWEKLTDAVQNYDGTVEGMSNTRLDSFSSEVKILKNNWQNTASIMYKSVEPALRKIVKVVTELMQNEIFKKDIARMAKGVGNAISFVADVIKHLGPAALSSGKNVLTMLGNFAGFNLVTTNVLKGATAIFNFAKGLSTLNSANAVATTGVAKLVNVLSLLSNNIGLVAITAGAAAGAAGYVISAIHEENAARVEQLQELYGVTNAMQSQIDKSTELVDAYKTLNETSAQNAEQVSQNTAGYQALVDQYNSLIDSNGQVIAGNEAQADYIVGQLSDALGVEKNKILECRDANGLLGESIQQVILAKQAEAYLAAYQEQYNEAIKNASYYEQNYLADLQARNDQQEIVDQLLQEFNSLSDECSNATKRAGESNDDYRARVQAMSEQLHDTSGKLSLAEDALKKCQGQLNESATVWEKSKSDIANYNQMLEDSAKQNFSGVVEAADSMADGIGNATKNSNEYLYQQTVYASDDYVKLRNAFNKGETGITKEQVDAAKKRLEKCQEAYNESSKMARESGENTGQGLIDGERSKLGDQRKANIEFANVGHSAYREADNQHSPSRVMYGYGQNTAQGAINGINSKQSEMYNAGASLARAANNGYKKTLDIRSPSRVMKQNGIYTVQGLENGIDERMRSLAEKTRELSDVVTGNAHENLYGTGNTTNTNYDNSTYSPSYNITINQQAGENAEALAQRVSELIDRDARRRQLAWK